MKIYRDILNFYGPRKQILKAIEEMAELQKELCKYETENIKNRLEIAEEVADVEIMLAQLKILFGIDEAVIVNKLYKLQRTRERMEGK